MSTFRSRTYEIIFHHDTRAGKIFDVVLIVLVALNVLVVMLDSVQAISEEHRLLLHMLEWFFTVVFTLEYILRLYSSPRLSAYAFSFFGIVDLLAILPSYLNLLLPGSRFLLTIRILRLLRIFRILKLTQFVGEEGVLARALWASRHKITVFLLAVGTVVVVAGSLMYVVEGADSGFTSIPQSIYWAIVTLTTVGYGDIAPRSPLGQALAAALMITGYGIIAVPTGIVTVELGRASGKGSQTSRCPECGIAGHDADARFCKRCGAGLLR